MIQNTLTAILILYALIATYMWWVKSTHAKAAEWQYAGLVTKYGESVDAYQLQGKSLNILKEQHKEMQASKEQLEARLAEATKSSASKRRTVKKQEGERHTDAKSTRYPEGMVLQEQTATSTD